MSIGLLWGGSSGTPIQIPEAVVEAELQAYAAATKSEQEPKSSGARSVRQAWAWCRSFR
jgi:hypothetical protein